MNINPETDLDLEKLFLPAWAVESASTAKRFAKYTGEESYERADRRRGERPGGRVQPGAGEPGEPKRGGRGPARERGPREARRRRAETRAKESAAEREPRGRGRREAGGPRAARGERPAAPPAPLPELQVRMLPDAASVERLARQIRATGRAYPLFEIAKLILESPARYQVELRVQKKPDGSVAQPLFVCALDDTPWLTEAEAVAHVLKRHFQTFYQAERTPVDPPKGTYTFVAQCGLSGEILGPPNYHDYQNRVRKLHAEKFARMPLEAYKARIKIIRDPEIVKQWIEEQSYRTEYVCLNVPEPLRLPSREAVEQHFREVHQPNLIRSVETHVLSGTAARGVRSPELARLIRHTLDTQQRFPLQVATVLSQQFAAAGLHFFKVNRTVTHVWGARPTYLDLDSTPVSQGVRRIVEFVRAHPQCTRRQILDALAPAPVSSAPPPAEGTAFPPLAEPTPEQTAVIADLHWLIHQGHLIEFANGTIEATRKPSPKPAKPAPATAAAPAATPETPAPAAPEAWGAVVTEADSVAGEGEAVDGTVAAPSPEPATESTDEPPTSPVASEAPESRLPEPTRPPNGLSTS